MGKKKTNSNIINFDNSIASINNVNKTINKSIGLLDKFTGAMNDFNRLINKTTNSLKKSENLSNSSKAKRANVNQPVAATAAVAVANTPIAGVEPSSGAVSSKESEASGAGEMLPINLAAGLDIGKKIMEQADAYAHIQSRLKSINDGEQTSEELNERIMASANRMKMPYENVANMIADLGTNAGESFNSTEEMVQFAELMNKQFKMGGGSAEQQAEAVNTMTQAMASGSTSGEGLNNMLQQAPILAQTLANKLNVPTNELEEMGNKGLITSNLIKQAMFNSAAETEAQFSKLPMTFSDVGALIKNQVTQTLNPVFEQLLNSLNSESGMAMIQSIIQGFCMLGTIVGWVLMGLISMGDYFSSNMDIIQPAIMGVVFALGLYKAALFTSNLVAGGKAIIEAIAASRAAAHAKATLALAAATGVATGAQASMNTALLASPLTWIVIVIMAIVAAFYILIGVINKFFGTAISATGVIIGAIFAAGTFILNLVIGIINTAIQYWWSFFVEPFIGIIEFVLNVLNGGFSSVGDGVKNLIGNIIAWFLSLGTIVTKIIDAIFGTKWTDGLNELKGSMLSWGKNEKAITLNRNPPTINYRGDVSNAWETGYGLGKKIDSYNPKSMFNDYMNPKFDNPSDPNKNQWDKLVNNNAVKNIDKNVGSMKNNMQMSEEDLKYLRDIAEQEIINRFTTAEVKVEQNNQFGDIRETADLDGIMAHLERTVRETISVSAEGAELYV